MPANIAVIMHHQEHGEGDADQQRGELGLVIHQQLESDPQDATVLHGAFPFARRALPSDRDLFIAFALTWVWWGGGRYCCPM
jgi:hypothetical protein